MIKKLIILGATGSIGRNAVDVAAAHPSDFKVEALAARYSLEECQKLSSLLGARCYCGEDAAVRAVEENDANICLVSTVGLSGLKPTLLAIEKGMWELADRRFLQMEFLIDALGLDRGGIKSTKKSE
jgi:1-deoxy-D-xylulose-5-phosphate reductoisomerase